MVPRQDPSSGNASRKRTRDETLLDENLGRFLHTPSTGGYFVNSENITESSPESQWSTLKKIYMCADDEDNADATTVGRIIERSPRIMPPNTSSVLHQLTGDSRGASTSRLPPTEDLNRGTPSMPSGEAEVHFLDGPLYEGDHPGAHPKIRSWLTPLARDSVAQLDYLQSTTSQSAINQLRKFSDWDVERAKVHLAYLSHNVDVESNIRFQQREEYCMELERQRSALLEEVSALKVRVQGAEEKARLADEASKTAEAKLMEISGVRMGLDQIKQNLAAAHSEREQDRLARLKAEEDYEKLRTSIPAIFDKALNSPEVTAPFRRFVDASREVGSFKMLNVLSSLGVQIPSPYPDSVRALFSDDCYDKCRRAADSLKNARSALIREIGGGAHIPIDRILEML